MSDLPAGGHAQKLGDVVESSGRTTLAEAGDDWVVIFTVPEVYRPDHTVPCDVQSQAGPLELWIKPDGSVTADSPRAGWIELDGSSYSAA